MKRFVVPSLLLSLALFAVPALACTGSGQARSHLNSFAHGLHSLSGHFSQTLTNAAGGQGQTSVGNVALETPRMFRWQTTSPNKQLIVADGSHVWMYEPDLEQVTVRPQSSAAAHSPLTVITDVSRLDKDFNCTEMGTHDGLAWLRLTPKDDQAQFSYAELGFDGNGLAAMVFKDQLANVTRIRFSDWQRNQSLPASTFSFTPPKGADVVGDISTVPLVTPLNH